MDFIFVDAESLDSIMSILETLGIIIASILSTLSVQKVARRGMGSVGKKFFSSTKLSNMDESILCDTRNEFGLNLVNAENVKDLVEMKKLMYDAHKLVSSIVDQMNVMRDQQEDSAKNQNIIISQIKKRSS